MPHLSSLRWVAIFALFGCSSPEHQLLVSAKPGGNSSLSAPSGNGGTGGSGGGSGAIGGNPGTGGCSPGECGARRTCESDRDCRQSPGLVCVGDQCVECNELPTTLPACPWDWVPMPIFRNDCPAAKCSPPDRCWRNEDCPPGLMCYPGVDCPEPYPGGPMPPPPGTGTPPCHGNVCAVPGCPDAARLDCMVVGCDNDFTCQSSCTFSGTSSVCSCDPMTMSWVCGAGCGTSQCVPPS